MRRTVPLLVLALLLPGCVAGLIGGLVVSDLSNQAHANELARQNGLLSYWRGQGMTEAEIAAKIRTDEPKWWTRLEERRKWNEKKAAEAAKPKPVPRYSKD